MANISKYLEWIIKSRYGRDVRSAIHDAIDAVNSSAEGSAAAAERSASTASICAYKAKESELAAEQSVNTASICAYNAKMSELAAEQSMSTASICAYKSKMSELATERSMSTASICAYKSKVSELVTEQSMSTASICAYKSKVSELTAREMASIARSWAEGTDGEVREGDEVNNSRYHSLQSQLYAELARKYCEKIEQAGYKMCGSYDDAVAYDYPDIVFYDGSSYVAKKETMGNTPGECSEYWQIFASGLKGTIDYKDLGNKPLINGVELSGNDELADLGILQPDWSETDDASNAFIKNKPDLKTIATTGKYSDLVDTPALKEVATSGSYNDLDNKPSIPAAAKNGKLTIQRNGDEVQTFTADQSSDATANILVPTISNSAAVTQTGQMALDAVEKNASIEGTLAHQIAQVNGSLKGIKIGLKSIGLSGTPTMKQIDKAMIESGGGIILLEPSEFSGVIPVTGSWGLVILASTDYNGNRNMFLALDNINNTSTSVRLRVGFSVNIGTKTYVQTVTLS